MEGDAGFDGPSPGVAGAGPDVSPNPNDMNGRDSMAMKLSLIHICRGSSLVCFMNQDLVGGTVERVVHLQGRCILETARRSLICGILAKGSLTLFYGFIGKIPIELILTVVRQRLRRSMGTVWLRRRPRGIGGRVVGRRRGF